MIEQWRPIEGYENYDVSDLGRVRRIRGVTKPRHVKDALKLSVGSCGYSQISLCRNGQKKTHLVHRLVMQAFCGEAPDGHEVAHLDGNTENNCLSNLEYVTPKVNQSHCVRHGTAMRGATHGMAKLNEMQVRIIKRLRGLSQREVGEIFGICQVNVSGILRGKIWKNLQREDFGMTDG
jgi:hypothetical protein